MPLQGIYAYVTLDEGVEATEDLRKELINAVREEIGAFAAPDVIHWAPGGHLRLVVACGCLVIACCRVSVHCLYPDINISAWWLYITQRAFAGGVTALQR